MKSRLLLLSFFYLTGPSNLLFAQTNTSKEANLSFSMGPYMLAKVPRVKEIIPFAGFRLSFPLGSFRPEILPIHGRTQGITYYRIFLSLRNNIYIPGMDPNARRGLEAMKFFWTTGMHYDEYQQAPLPTGQTTPFQKRGGIHFGFGLAIPLGANLRFRSDFYYNLRPGLGFFIGGGFVVPLSGQENISTQR